MYQRRGFENSGDVVNFLNERNIKKEDIVSVTFDSSKSNQYWIYTLIYYDAEA